MTQLPLFDVPDGERRPPPVGAKRADRVTATRYRSTKRILCDDCCRLVHQRGQGKAPLPLPARWRVVIKSGDVAYLCNDHKDWRMGS